MPSSTDIISLSRSFIGIKYLYGGSSPSTGFDCSGFLYYVFKQFNIDIGRTTFDQIKKGTKISKKEDLLPGDLVFLLDYNKQPYHVVMYTGNNMIIESPRTGLNVREIEMYAWNNEARRILIPIIPPPIPISPSNALYRVVCGSFSSKENANKRVKLLLDSGFSSFLLFENNFFKVICGSFSNSDLANSRFIDLKNKGFDSFIIKS